MKVIVKPEGERFRLYVQHTRDSNPEPAGPRLGRGEPLPITKFAFDTRGQATSGAARLQSYIESEHTKKPTQ